MVGIESPPRDEAQHSALGAFAWSAGQAEQGRPRDRAIEVPSTLKALAGGVGLGLIAFALVAILGAGTGYWLLVLTLAPLTFAAYRLGLAAGLAAIAVCFALVGVFAPSPASRASDTKNEQLLRLVGASSVALFLAAGADQLRRSQSTLDRRAEERNSLQRERDAALQALARERAVLETVVGNAPVGIGLWDGELRCVHANNKLAEMSGVPRDAMIGRRPDEYLREWWPQWKPHFEAALAGRASVDVELSGTDSAGRWEAVIANYYPYTINDAIHGVALVCTDVTEQRLAQELLARSEQRYRELSESMPALVALVDGEGNAYYWNRAFFEYSGLTVDQTPNWLALGLVPPEDLEAAGEDWFRETRAGNAASAEVRVRRHDGVYRWHLVRAVPLDSRKQWLLVATDIDDTKRSEEQLRASRERLALAANATGSGMWDVDLASGKAVWSESHFHLLGYPVAEEGAATMSMWTDRVHPEDVRQLEEELSKAQANCCAFTVEHRIVRANSGEVRWLSEAGRFIEAASGVAVRMVGVSSDVTERRLAEVRAHRLAEARSVLAETVDYREALEALGKILIADYGDWVSIFAVTNPGDERPGVDRLVCLFNPAVPELERLATAPLSIDWRASLGLPQVIRSGQPELVSQATAESFAAAADESLRALSQSVIQSRMLVPLKIGGAIVGAIALASTERGRYAKSDLLFLEEFAQQAASVMEKARLFSDLRAANAAKDEFLSLVSHELRTPITTILGNATVLTERGEQVSEADVDTAIRDIRDEAARLNDIIENLLSLARLDRGAAVETEPLFVRRIVSRVLESNRGEHLERTYILSFPTNPVFVEGNAVYLEQVMRNLIANAHRYSNITEPIEIAAESDGKVLRVSILDRGIGIDPAEAEALFEPFYRSPRTASVKGVGVGLALCRRLVEFQGGQLTAAPRPGGGAAFTVSLPVADATD